MCGHNAKAEGVVIDLYKIKFSLCDLSATLNEKPIKVLVSKDAKELTGLSPVKFNELCCSDQLDF